MLTEYWISVVVFWELLWYGHDVQDNIFLNTALLGGLASGIAEWIAIFITTNTTVKIVLLIVNIPIYFIIGRLIFGDWRRFWKVVFWRVVMFSLTPLFILFRRDIFRKNSWTPPTYAEIGMAILLNFLFIGLYSLQYILLKTVFFS